MQLNDRHCYTLTSKHVTVSVCGDEVCELEENCLNCPADCGVCPMSITIKVAIGLPVALFCSGFILTIVVSLCNTCSQELQPLNKHSTLSLNLTFSSSAVVSVSETEDVLG